MANVLNNEKKKQLCQKADVQSLCLAYYTTHNFNNMKNCNSDYRKFNDNCFQLSFFFFFFNFQNNFSFIRYTNESRIFETTLTDNLTDNLVVLSEENSLPTHQINLGDNLNICKCRLFSGSFILFFFWN